MRERRVALGKAIEPDLIVQSIDTVTGGFLEITAVVYYFSYLRPIANANMTAKLSIPNLIGIQY